MLPTTHKDNDKITEFCAEVLELENTKLPSEYYYSSLPLCVIDSVFSIGVRYESVKNTVSRFCSYFNLNQGRRGTEILDISEQFSIEEYLSSFESLGLEIFVNDVLKNKQRTSPTNGILKAEAVYLFCKILNKYGVNYLQDVKKIYGNEEFENEIRTIPGQKSGISLVYFYMLAGDDQWIKPDRMITRFLEKVLQRKVKLEEAQSLLDETTKLLKKYYPNITPRLLDYQIWNFERSSN
ncbi:hypothetical protein G4D61_12685 [Bacillus ginsengihumi]|uniref:Uncharacterized protein n=1 Tax=Heyndrickxia ginsengihumi TaxID=363870 RepID=A0A6M0PA41_9BACI|nr:hypothetical protein [Heyndrickxia ginsengihumi]MBE6185163.1 hypothetical protein [Bacillus sp. (in: firmicutes)]NEY20809.1 hypothetical protein [Heyndrickxia ginsengihumi]